MKILGQHYPPTPPPFLWLSREARGKKAAPLSRTSKVTPPPPVVWFSRETIEGFLVWTPKRRAMWGHCFRGLGQLLEFTWTYGSPPVYRALMGELEGNPEHVKYVAVGQNPVPLVNIKIGGRMDVHPPQNGAIGYAPWPCVRNPSHGPNGPKSR